MRHEQITAEIRELNLCYLLLAKQLLQQDRAAAIYRLGISKEVADILENLSAGQVLKMAASNLLLCRFRLDDRLILEMVTHHSRTPEMAEPHSAILLARQPVEQAA